MVGTLDGVNVLVVGASAGIGRAFALEAIRAGAQVALTARRADRLDEAIQNAGGGLAVVGDVRRTRDCERLVATAVEALGPIDLVLYAAGYAPLRFLIETDPDEWNDVFETNVFGVQHVLRAVVPKMSARGIAAVLSSETVHRPRLGLGAYGASKAALTQSLQTWRIEHPELRFSCVTVGATQPTDFGTEFDGAMLDSVLRAWEKLGLLQEQFMHTDEVARVLVDVYAALLPFPGVGLENLDLRSPSAVIGTRDLDRRPAVVPQDIDLT
jgi:NADP-dependent 3-hydroxy acid dehydrogenase YdfG